MNPLPLPAMALSLLEFRDRILRFRRVWESLAPEKVFSKVSYEKFCEETEESLAVRERILDLEIQLRGLRAERSAADRKSRGMMRRLVWSVAGDKNFGEDSGFYKALGFIPKSERKTGRVRRKGRKKR
ncbi:hypothetical protein [Haloferula sargassicola]|uniref:Transposase n=1 Tax=Haloferula sargassicola TaxID=490096 RepID=A0ABP9UY73_9BACT